MLVWLEMNINDAAENPISMKCSEDQRGNHTLHLHRAIKATEHLTWIKQSLCVWQLFN